MSRRVLAAALTTLLVATALVLVPQQVADALGSPNITLAAQTPANILFGDDGTVTLVASNPVGEPKSFNLSFRAVLPTGVSYTAASTTPTQAGEPTVFANKPAAGQTTLVWLNVGDIAPNGTAQIAFKVHLTSTGLAAPIQVGDTFSIDAGAYVNGDARFVPDFDANGAPVGTNCTPVGPACPSFTGSATATGTTKVSAVKVEIDEPNPEGEILRGVHDKRTTYTLTVTNNSVNATNAVTLDAWVPAGLEYLACADVDNTSDAPTNVGSAVEYPGAPDLTDGNGAAPTNCTTPTLVETLNSDPDGVGPLGAAVRTHVRWSLGSLAASQVVLVKYLAAIPIRENTLTFTTAGGTPSPASRLQGANLDNNNGAETFDEQALVTYATVQGTYTGTIGTGSNPVADDDTNTRTAEDVRLLKSVSSGVIAAAPLDTWTLTLDTSEYRTANTISLTDTLPNGLCPLDTAAEYELAPDDPAECEPGAGRGPSLAYQSVVENPNGTYSMAWTVPDMGSSATTVVTFKTQSRRSYQSGGADTTPVVGGDSWTNATSVSARDVVICDGGDTTCVGAGVKIAHDEIDNVADLDVSSASQSAPQPTVQKRVAVNTPGSALDCATATYVDETSGATYPPHYAKGDRICWDLLVTFPTDVMTRNPVVSDFIPVNTTFIAGSAAAGPANTVGTVTPDLSGDPLTWTLSDLTVGPDKYVDEGKVFEVRFATLAGSRPTTVGQFDLVQNLMKLTSQDTLGRAIALRDDVNYELGEPHLTLTKVIASVNGVANGTHAATVRQGDTVSYRVDVTNNGAVPASDVNVRDILPAQLTCSDVVGGTISDGGACGSGVLNWTAGDIPTIAVGATKSLTFDVLIPTGATAPAAGETLLNRAGVRTYTTVGNGGTTGVDTGTTFTYVPSSNIDTSLNPSANTDPANDSATVTMVAVALVKTVATEVTDTGNTALSQVTPGEELTYTVTFTVPAGSNLYSGSLTDTLPATLTLLGTSSALMNGGALPGGVTLTENVGTRTITLAFGATYQNPTGDDVYVITVPAKVNVAGTAPTRGNVVANTANFNSKNADGSFRPTVFSTANVTTVEPTPGVTKAHNDADGVVVPGQDLTYTVTATNGVSGSNTSVAYEVVMVDTIPAGLSVQTGTISGGGTYNVGTREITWNIASIDPGSTAARTYHVTVDALPVGAASYTNTVAVTATNLTGSVDDDGEKSYGPFTASKTVTAPTATIIKSASPTTATIGEASTFTLTATIPADVLLFNTTVVDTLPDGLTFQSYGAMSSTCVGDPGCVAHPGDVITPSTLPAVHRVSGATDVAWFLGDLGASTVVRTVTLTVTATVDLTYETGGGAVTAGNALTDTTKVYWDNDNVKPDPVAIPATPSTAWDRSSAPATAAVTVTEPLVGIDKDVVGQVADTDVRSALPGTTLTYTVAVTASAAANRGPAYDVQVTDTPDSELTNVVLTPNAAISVLDGWTVGDPDIVFRINGSLAPGATVTLTYTADVKASGALNTGDQAINIATVDQFFGIDQGAPPPAAFKTYAVGSPDVDVVTVNLDFPSLTIAKTTGSGAETGTAEVLQPFTWKVVVTNSSLTTATAKGVDVRDTMPADWVYVPGSAKLDGVATGNPVIVPHAAGDDLAWTDLRDVVPGAFLTVTYDATPQLAAGSAANPQVNVASATASDVSSSTGNLSGPYAAGPDPASATVAKPVLAISKTPDGAATRSPVATSFTITITNSGTVAARSLIVTDTLPTSQLTYANGTATAAPTALASEDTSVPGTITWTIATLAAGASTVITMPVNVKPGLVSGTTIVNGGSVISRELTVAVSDTGSLVVGASSDLSLTKVISNPTPVVGQAIDYTITVSNAGLDAAAGVTVLDVLPPQVTFVSASGNGTYNALTGIWTIGAMPALATKTIQINVTVNAPVLGDPSPVVNVAEINASSAFDPDSTPNNGIVGEDDRATASFVLAPGATVGDFVWQDSNGDGRQTGGEPGVAGVTVRLLNSLDVVVATTSTNGAGAYGFGGLAAGTYRVEVVIPGGGWQASPVDQGTDTGDSDINALTGRTPLFTLVAGQNNSTLDAGLFQPASVGDRVWADTDGDGVQDPGELGVAGVTVKLLDGAGVTLATTVTSATGIYGFATLIAGSYRIELVVPSGYSLTGVDAGADDALDSDIVAATSRTPTFTLTSGQVDLTRDAGLVLVPSGGRDLGNLVWHDRDADGVLDAGEPGLAGITVQLFDGNGGLLGSTTTDSAGGYLFGGLAVGRYQVRFQVPSGWSTSPPNQGASRALDSDANQLTGRSGFVDLGPSDLTVDAGLFQPGALGDRVWRDLDGDGTQGAGEPGITGVQLALVDANGNTLATTTTDSSGAYGFAGLAPGVYAVVVLAGTLPAGLHNTGDPDGTFDGRASHQLVEGESFLGLDFGYVAGGTTRTPPRTPPTTTPPGRVPPGELVPGPALALQKSLEGRLVTGHSATYALTISNVGTVDDPGPLTLVDSMPAGLTFVASATAGWTCAAAGQEVTCRWAGGLPSAEVLVLRLQVRVVAAAGRTIVNRATVSGISAATSDLGSAVLSESETADVSPAGLPFTGAALGGMLLLALGLLGSGASLVAASRRRRRP